MVLCADSGVVATRYIFRLTIMLLLLQVTSRLKMGFTVLWLFIFVTNRPERFILVTACTSWKRAIVFMDERHAIPCGFSLITYLVFGGLGWTPGIKYYVDTRNNTLNIVAAVRKRYNITRYMLLRKTYLK